jgi:hypothetical protein
MLPKEIATKKKPQIDTNGETKTIKARQNKECIGIKVVIKHKSIKSGFG